MEQKWIVRFVLWFRKVFLKKHKKHEILEKRGRWIRKIRSFGPIALGILSSILMLVLLFCLGIWVWQKYFDNKVDEFKIFGLNKLERNQVVSQLRADGIDYGVDLEQIDSLRIIKSLGRVPEISQARIQIVPGGTIQIEVIEAEALAKTWVNETWWYLLDQGKWTTQNIFDETHLVVLENELYFENEIPEKSIEMALYLRDMKKNHLSLYQNLSQIQVRGLDLFTVWNYLENVVIVRTETPKDELEFNLLNLQKQSQFLAQQNQNSALANAILVPGMEIDLRFSGYAFLR